MGLDITSYQRLKPAPDAQVDADGESIDGNSYANITQGLIDFTERDFPGRAEGLAPGIYTFASQHGFRAGSYGGYNSWRNDLAIMAYGMSAEKFWKQKAEGPFTELINFSDCEGVIGPVVAAKLQKDFAEWVGRAQHFAKTIEDGEWWLDRYGEWQIAFAMAADNGCVEFH